MLVATRQHNVKFVGGFCLFVCLFLVWTLIWVNQTLRFTVTDDFFFFSFFWRLKQLESCCLARALLLHYWCDILRHQPQTWCKPFLFNFCLRKLKKAGMPKNINILNYFNNVVRLRQPDLLNRINCWLLYWEKTPRV